MRPPPPDASPWPPRTRTDPDARRCKRRVRVMKTPGADESAPHLPPRSRRWGSPHLTGTPGLAQGALRLTQGAAQRQRRLRPWPGGRPRFFPAQPGDCPEGHSSSPTPGCPSRFGQPGGRRSRCAQRGQWARWETARDCAESSSAIWEGPGVVRKPIRCARCPPFPRPGRPQPARAPA